eukprot:PhM_4_TR6124/c0_g1_i1/m.4594
MFDSESAIRLPPPILDTGALLSGSATPPGGLSRASSVCGGTTANSTFSIWRECILRVLTSNQGRDKVLKIVQYLIRFHLWFSGVGEVEFGVKRDDSYTRLERNAMSIQNTRRLFRIGRFIAEWIRIRVTILRCSELFLDHSDVQSMVFMQSQMFLDILARLLSIIKSVSDDVLYFSRKEIINPALHEPLERLNPKLFIPVLLIDMYLNFLRMAQYTVDKLMGRKMRHRQSFSLYSRYDINDQRRHSPLPDMPTPMIGPFASPGTGPTLDSPYRSSAPQDPDNEISPHDTFTIEADEPETPTADISLLRRVASLCWRDDMLFWMCMTQAKYSLDLTVGISYAYDLPVSKGIVTLLGLTSGIISTWKICVDA